jgi:putative membrane protein
MAAGWWNTWHQPGGLVGSPRGKGTTMMDWYGGSGMGAWAPFMWLFMGVFWVALIGLIIWLVTRLLPGSANPRPGTPAPGPVESPEQVLDRMFALGEIDEATYRSRRTALSDMRRPS